VQFLYNSFQVKYTLFGHYVDKLNVFLAYKENQHVIVIHYC